MKNKIITLAILTTTLCGCSIVQAEPEVKDNPIEEIEKPHEVIIGFGDAGPNIPFAIMEQNEYGVSEINPLILSGSYSCYMCPVIYETIDGHRKVSLSVEGRSKYVESSIKKYGDIFEPEKSGSIYIDATIDIAIYSDQILVLCYYLLDIDTGLVTCESLPSQVIDPGLTKISTSIDDSYHSQNNENNAFEKHSYLGINLNYIYNLDKSFTIFEYNKNDEIIKSSNGNFDWTEYELDENTEYYIIETISDIYRKHDIYVDKSIISETNVKTKKLFNKRDKDVRIDFYHDPQELEYVNKTTLRIVQAKEN